MVKVYVITSIYAFEEAEKLKKAMVGVDAWTRPGVNAFDESELMVGADAWTKPAINAFHNAMLKEKPQTQGPGSWVFWKLENCSRKLYTANARHEQMTQMQGQHFLKK
jgi:hypothetical protein